jgi:hypothetical protein
VSTFLVLTVFRMSESPPIHQLLHCCQDFRRLDVLCKELTRLLLLSMQCHRESFSFPQYIIIRDLLRPTFIKSHDCIGGLVVKLAVAILHNDRTVSASPGFDSRPMHFAAVEASR